MANDTPARPWLIYVNGELYGDFKTETNREKALPGTERGRGGSALPVADRWLPRPRLA